MAVCEPISAERGSGAPDEAQKPSINQRTIQMEGLALNQPKHNTKRKINKRGLISSQQ